MADNFWTHSKTEELVELYHANPCLYDINLPGYRVIKLYIHSFILKRYSYQLCELVVFELAPEVTRKINSIRTQYMREKKKGANPKSGSGAADANNKSSKWWLLNQLDFLSPFVEPKTTRSNLMVCKNSFS